MAARWAGENPAGIQAAETARPDCPKDDRGRQTSQTLRQAEKQEAQNWSGASSPGKRPRMP